MKHWQLQVQLVWLLSVAKQQSPRSWSQYSPLLWPWQIPSPSSSFGFYAKISLTEWIGSGWCKGIACQSTVLPSKIITWELCKKVMSPIYLTPGLVVVDHSYFARTLYRSQSTRYCLKKFSIITGLLNDWIWNSRNLHIKASPIHFSATASLARHDRVLSVLLTKSVSQPQLAYDNLSLTRPLLSLLLLLKIFCSFTSQ